MFDYIFEIYIKYSIFLFVLAKVQKYLKLRSLKVSQIVFSHVFVSNTMLKQ